MRILVAIIATAALAVELAAQSHSSHPPTLVNSLTSSGETAPEQPAAAKAGASNSWTQWGGPTRNFIVNTTGLADKWPEAGPPVIWSRPLGTGHSAILVDDGRLYTM